MAKPEKDDRLFAPFPIEMDEHPKIIGLSDAAFRAIFEGTFYARRMLSDGFLDERVVLRRWGREVAEELASNDPERPSWVRVESPRAGWQIHDFEKHHPLKAEIEAKRADLSEKRARAGRKGAAKRWQGDSKSVANDSSETETETETETEVSSKELTTRAREAFETVWLSWPKKTEKKKSQEQFVRAAQRVGVDALSSWVSEFGRAYAGTTETQYVPALAVWLRNERWTDELPQSKRQHLQAVPSRADVANDFVKRLEARDAVGGGREAPGGDRELR